MGNKMKQIQVLVQFVVVMIVILCVTSNSVFLENEGKPAKKAAKKSADKSGKSTIVDAITKKFKKVKKDDVKKWLKACKVATFLTKDGKIEKKFADAMTSKKDCKNLKKYFKSAKAGTVFKGNVKSKL